MYLMGKVDAFEIAGLDVRFNSLDHLPRHFHVIKPGKWEIRVAFLECTQQNLAYVVKWHVAIPSGRDLKRILAEVLEHRVQLDEEWSKKVALPPCSLTASKKGNV
jgi:hypothetical protein